MGAMYAAIWTVSRALDVVHRVTAQLRELRERFRDVHRRGTAALDADRFDELNDAIAAERHIFERQATLIHRFIRVTRELQTPARTKPTDPAGNK